MNARRLRRVAMIAAVGSGFLGLAIGPFDGLSSGAAALVGAAGLCLGAPWLRGASSAWPWPVSTLAIGAGLALGAGAGALSPIEAVGALLVYLQVHRALIRSGPADDRIALVLSLLMLVIAAETTTSPLFLALGVPWAAAATVALLVGQLEDGAPSGGRTSRLVGYALGTSCLVLALAASLFLALPRLRVPPIDGAGSVPVASTGFRAQVQLGDLAALFDDATPVLRVRVVSAAAPEPLYLRGIALDHFDGHRWTSTAKRSTVTVESALALGVAPRPPGSLVLELRREPLDEGVLFTSGEVLGMYADEGVLERDDQGAWFLPGPPRAVDYALVTEPFGSASAVDRPSDLLAYLALPGDVDPRVVELAAALASDAAGAPSKIEATRRYLAENHAYGRGTPAREAGEDPLAAFLFGDRVGHCEQFASALAVLLRAEGVPTRLVNGLAGGEYNEFGNFWLFRRAHAHAWVEAYVAGQGWRGVDATPAATPPRDASGGVARAVDAARALWYDGVLAYDLAEQADLVLRLGRDVAPVIARVSGGRVKAETPWVGLVLVAAVTFGLVAVAIGGWRILEARLVGPRRSGRPRGRVARAHERARAGLQRRGWRIPSRLPPVAAARWLRDRVGPEAAPLEELAWLHYQVRYGQADDTALAASARSLVAEIAQIGPPPPAAVDDAVGER
jgi:transglutaminase-like putative cysteine protease